MHNGSLNHLVEKARDQRRALVEVTQDDTPGSSSFSGTGATRQLESSPPPERPIETLRHWIAERPRTALAIALAAGAVVVSRSSRSTSNPSEQREAGGSGAVSKGLMGLALAPVAMQFVKQRLMPMGIQWAIAQAVRYGARPQDTTAARTRATPSTTRNQSPL